MKKAIRKLLVFFMAIIVLFAPMAYSGTYVVVAHSGRTDANGGHKDNKNVNGLGSYHYHCGGHPAHLHINGKCPYDNTDTEPTQGDTLYLTGETTSKETAASVNKQSNTSDIKESIPEKLKESTTSKTDSAKKKESNKKESKKENKKENKKELIKKVQKALNDLGYDCGKADGILGKKQRRR